jgi:hypothetical protein
MVINDEALHLAGLALAHALWSASDLEDDDMVVPLAFVRDGDETKLLRFESETQEQAIRLGQIRMKELTGKGMPWAFARDGIVREEGVPIDVIVVEAWSVGCEVVVSVIQRYVPFAREGVFRLHGGVELALGGQIVPQEHASDALAVVEEGFQSHTAVAALVPSWRTGG